MTTGKTILTPIALALGANLGQPRQSFAKAVELLQCGGLQEIRLASPLQSPAQNCYPGTPDFVNSVLTGRWAGSPEKLLQLTQDIEVALGRPTEHDSRASRLIDLDLLLFGDLIMQTRRLTIPHPRLRLRLFVLEPLAEIAPDWLVPPDKISVRQLLEQQRQQEKLPQ